MRLYPPPASGSTITDGTVSAADLDAALTAVLAAKALKATTVTAGTGLTGGGDLSASRTVALSTGSVTSLGKADTATQPGDLGGAAALDVGTTAGTVAAGDDARVVAGGTAYQAPGAGIPPTHLTAEAQASLAAADAAAPKTTLIQAARAPAFPAASSAVTLAQSGHGWLGSTGFVADSTTDWCMGVQAMRIVTGGTGATYKIEKTGLSVNTTGQQIRLRMKVVNADGVHTIQFLAGNASDYAACYTWTLLAAPLGSEVITEGDWVTVTLPFSSAAVTGSPTRTGIAAMKLTVRDTTDQVVTAHLQSVELVPEPATAFPNGLVSITFDDGWDTQWSLAKPILDAAGLKATLFNIQDRLDVAGRLSTAQLHLMQDQGHEICPHITTLVNHDLTWTGLTAAGLAAEVNAQVIAHRQAGLRGAGTAYPSGAYGQTADDAPTMPYARRFAYARTVCARFHETFPPAEPRRLRAQSGISSYAGGYDPALVYTGTTGHIDRAKDASAWLILVFHRLTAGVPASTAEVTTTEFQAIVDKVVSAGVACLPIGDALAYHG
jgi:peptidoglycan/xylan/chitin deacetylase (PgdA/CDA1 family)